MKLREHFDGHLVPRATLGKITNSVGEVKFVITSVLVCNVLFVIMGPAMLRAERLGEYADVEKSPCRHVAPSRKVTDAYIRFSTVLLAFQYLLLAKIAMWLAARRQCPRL